MPPFIYFLVLLSVSLAAVIGLRLTLLRTGRHIQKHVGFSDTALTDIAVTLPLKQLHDRLRRGSRLVVVVKPRRACQGRDEQPPDEACHVVASVDNPVPGFSR